MVLIGMMIIPTIYSVIANQIHTQQYDNIITSVSYANEINQIAKSDLPNELWEIVNGKKDFATNSPYKKTEVLFKGISDMKRTSTNQQSMEKLEVAYRVCTTLEKNIEKLEMQIMNSTSVTENENLLDEIRTITSLFSDIMQDYILSQIQTASETNTSIKKASITLTILQLLIIIISLFFAISAYASVSKDINTPLSDMEKFSNEIASGNLAARTELPKVEELIPLAQNMNLMAEQIDLLLKKNIEEQKNFQKAEMKALQAQITPHFLYNTFDTIIWLAEQEETEAVITITKAFSNFLRISLSRGHEWITVQQELDHIKNYLTIQRIRYADILNYEIQVNKEIVDFKIIKLVLQPLIENAIYHGIKNKRGRGHINLTVDFYDESKESIIFTVEDDGAGFTEERLAEVKKELETGAENSENLSSVYGLYNVHKKLKLYYGDKTEGLLIESVHGKGSKIWFRIPCISGEENNV